MVDVEVLTDVVLVVLSVLAKLVVVLVVEVAWVTGVPEDVNVTTLKIDVLSPEFVVLLLRKVKMCAAFHSLSSLAPSTLGSRPHNSGSASGAEEFLGCRTMLRCMSGPLGHVGSATGPLAYLPRRTMRMSVSALTLRKRRKQAQDLKQGKLDWAAPLVSHPDF